MVKATRSSPKKLDVSVVTAVNIIKKFKGSQTPWTCPQEENWPRIKEKDSWTVDKENQGRLQNRCKLTSKIKEQLWEHLAFFRSHISSHSK